MTIKTLTEKNQKIIELLAGGKTIKEVASDINMKAKTVKARIERMRKDYRCTNTTQLVVTILSLHLD
jgi:DNA-binding NarL/FixJ family response regulator